MSMTTPLWTSDAAVAATGGRATVPFAVNGVSIDTRTIAKGDLFVALKAARDGHDFVAQALEAGAGAALVSRIPEGLPADAPLLLVDDVLKGLEDLGRAARARTKARVVGVTGSVGKTSTKEMLRTVLSGQGKVHAAEASYNNHWGVPLTLARMPADTDFAVIEIGMNHPGEIAPLSKMARPHAVIVTIVAPAHLEAFESIEGIAREKASITEGLEPKGVAILNGDLSTTSILVDAAKGVGARVKTFGERVGCHHRLLNLSIQDDITVAEARAWRTKVLFKVHAAGRHFAVNALSVIALCGEWKLDRAVALGDLAQWTPVKGRGARQPILMDPTDSRIAFELIDESYNANPASLGAALEVLSGAHPKNGMGRFNRGRKIAVVGDMRELGRTEAELHAGIAELPCVAQIDKIHCVGPLMRNLWQALPEGKRGFHADTSTEMATRMRGAIDAGDVVMVKGSLSMGLRHVVDALKKLGHPAAQPDQEDS
ncbi:UDP-N-acetylmuramoyl-tripeptide--D-alanyl-D-alanine ligase [Donghicola mangrovi]|nr:UDP-N-acetylmuramoyl-tripeptide--D-alanyl-D-alanine ligase [Donghicola mangrovi]